MNGRKLFALNTSRAWLCMNTPLFMSPRVNCFSCCGFQRGDLTTQPWHDGLLIFHALYALPFQLLVGLHLFCFFFFAFDSICFAYLFESARKAIARKSMQHFTDDLTVIRRAYIKNINKLSRHLRKCPHFTR